MTEAVAVGLFEWQGSCCLHSPVMTVLMMTAGRSSQEGTAIVSIMR